MGGWARFRHRKKIGLQKVDPPQADAHKAGGPPLPWDRSIAAVARSLPGRTSPQTDGSGITTIEFSITPSFIDTIVTPLLGVRRPFS